jgi:hypothetical protein
MSLGKINIITPPDNVFNFNSNYLLVKPSLSLKEKFQLTIREQKNESNVFIYEENDQDLIWLLSVSHQADVIIVDVDNCDSITKQFLGVLLMNPNSCYLTNDNNSHWNLINRNRIFNLDQISNKLYQDPTDDDLDDE